VPGAPCPVWAGSDRDAGASPEGGGAHRGAAARAGTGTGRRTARRAPPRRTAQENGDPMAQTRSLPAGRREAILDRVNAHGEARVAELAAELGVSVITVRRDLAGRDGEGLLQQVRGGAHRLAPRAEPDRTPDGDCPVDGGARLRDIGVVVPSLTYYWPRILRGASSAADGHGARLHIEAASPGAEDC